MRHDPICFHYVGPVGPVGCYLVGLEAEVDLEAVDFQRKRPDL